MKRRDPLSYDFGSYVSYRLARFGRIIRVLAGRWVHRVRFVFGRLNPPRSVRVLRRWLAESYHGLAEMPSHAPPVTRLQYRPIPLPTKEQANRSPVVLAPTAPVARVLPPSGPPPRAASASSSAAKHGDADTFESDSWKWDGEQSGRGKRLAWTLAVTVAAMAVLLLALHSLKPGVPAVASISPEVAGNDQPQPPAVTRTRRSRPRPVQTAELPPGSKDAWPAASKDDRRDDPAAAFANPPSQDASPDQRNAAPSPNDDASRPPAQDDPFSTVRTPTPSESPSLTQDDHRPAKTDAPDFPASPPAAAGETMAAKPDGATPIGESPSTDARPSNATPVEPEHTSKPEPSATEPADVASHPAEHSDPAPSFEPEKKSDPLVPADSTDRKPTTDGPQSADAAPTGSQAEPKGPANPAPAAAPSAPPPAFDDGPKSSEPAGPADAPAPVKPATPDRPPAADHPQIEAPPRAHDLPAEAPEANISFARRAPEKVDGDTAFVYQIVVRNNGPKSVKLVEIEEPIPEDHVVRMTNPPAETRDGMLHWALRDLAPHDARTIAIGLLPPLRRPPVVQPAEQPIIEAPTRVAPSAEPVEAADDSPRVRLQLIAPADAADGEPCRIGFRATNLGPRNSNLKVYIDLPPELHFARGQQLEYKVGALEEGESREDYLTAVATAPGKVEIRGQLVGGRSTLTRGKAVCRIAAVRRAGHSAPKPAATTGQPSAPAASDPCLCWP